VQVADPVCRLTPEAQQAHILQGVERVPQHIVPAQQQKLHNTHYNPSSPVAHNNNQSPWPEQLKCTGRMAPAAAAAAVAVAALTAAVTMAGAGAAAAAAAAVAALTAAVTMAGAGAAAAAAVAALTAAVSIAGAGGVQLSISDLFELAGIIIASRQLS
jgi:hypothetical protein